MKKLFVLLACAATMVACSKDYVVNADKGDAIEFGSFVENSTRAADPSYSGNDITAFKLYGTVNGVSIFNGANVTKDDEYGKAWAVTNDQGDEIKQYWIPEANYKFVGIVDGQKNGVTTTTIVDNMPTAIEYTADGATDLLCQTIDYTAISAAKVAAGDKNPIVAFNFTHLLSKVNFTVVNNSKDAAGYSFVVKNITFNGATKATYDVVNAGWVTPATATGNTVLGNERTVDLNTVKDIVVASGAASTELGTEVLFIPGEYTISFTVDILYNDQLVTTTNYPAAGNTYTHTLAANNAYNFNVNVAVGQLIEFTVTKQPTWTDGDGADDTTLLE